MKNIAIKEHHLYNKTYNRGRSFVGKTVAVYVLRDLAAGKLRNAHPLKLYVNRLGLSVSKKLGGAVARNRAKRIIRAAFDAVKKDLKTGNLIVISARFGIKGKKSTDVENELRQAFSKLEMFVTDADKSSADSKQENTTK